MKERNSSSDNRIHSYSFGLNLWVGSGDGDEQTRQQTKADEVIIVRARYAQNGCPLRHALGYK